MKPKTALFHVHDSETGEEFPDQGIASVSYSPNWQLVRMRCSFKTLDAARTTVATLDVYINRSTGLQEKQYRIWRAANLLRAIPLYNLSPVGTRRTDREVGHFLPDQTLRFLQMTDEVGKPTEWDWAVTRQEALDIWLHHPLKLRANCQSLYTKRGVVNSTSPKLELRYYLAICEAVMQEYMPLSLNEEAE